MRLVPLFFLFALTLVIPREAAANDLGEVAFRQALIDIETDLRLMCVAAHPDDEDGATLAYYRMLHGVETHAVIATRGEGGQNEIGPELYNELGVIRTREMKAAAEIEGAKLHFLDLPEFGYSKSPDETFDIWGRETALERMVRVIRETRPHVIITNHGRLKDHGHHQAIGTIVQEAFSAAADPEIFPQHLREGLETWKPLRLYIRDFRGGKGAIPNDIATLEPVRGKTIAEIAASALEVHESQGMKFFIDLLLSTQPKTYYHLVKNVRDDSVKSSVKGRGPLFDGLPWSETADRPDLDGRLVDRKTAGEVLLTWLAANEGMRTGSFDEQRRWAAVNRAAAIALELRLQASPSDQTVIPGQELDLEFKLRDFGTTNAIEATIELMETGGLGDIGASKMEAPLHKTGEAEGTFPIRIPAKAKHTLPLAPRLFEPDFLAPQLAVIAKVNCGDAVVELSVPVYLDVAPRLSITSPDAPYLLTQGEGSELTVRLLLTNNAPDALAEYVSLEMPEGWQVSPSRQSVSLTREGEQKFVDFVVQPPSSLPTGEIEARAGVVGATDRLAVPLRVVDLAVPEEVYVGVIQSYDDTFVTTLDKMGVAHATLNMDDFVSARLNAFDAIIVDIRAYQYRPDLVANNVALLNYVERGGTLLVMYQKTFDWQESYAPFPITLSRNRVTREDAPVEVLADSHPLMTSPNAIAAPDWEGWTQERGLYFPESWHEAYTPLVSTKDPGEEIPDGSYLVAQYGKGYYVYTALGWYRQLRELHPGALRCFANMIALRG